MLRIVHNVRYAAPRLVKTSRITAFAVIMLALGMAASGITAAGQSDQSSKAAGRWEGTIQIPGSEMVVVIDLAPDAKGAWTGSAIFPGLGVKGAPLAELSVKDSDVAFGVKGALSDPKFKAHIDATGNMVGQFEQGGNSAPFTLHKSGTPQVEPQPHSTAVSKALEGEWQGDFQLPGRTLHAKITLTNQPGAAATAKFIVIGKKENDLPVELVMQEDDLLTVDARAAGLVYQGWYRKETNEISGSLQIGPMDTPLVLHRAPKAGAESKP
jgi:hypothetical protein